MHRLGTAVTLLVVLAGAPGCGASPSVDGIPGSRVATMAEYQLEAMHADLASGTMTCPTLDFVVDASVRCVRIARLSGGRQIRVLGTVTVTSTRDGGKLHVRLDDKVAEFGIAADHLDNELRARAQRFLGVAPEDVSCPYLSGLRGTAVQCAVKVRDVQLVTVVKVIGVDPKAYVTRYRFVEPLFDRQVNPALPSLLRAIRRGGVAS